MRRLIVPLMCWLFLNVLLKFVICRAALQLLNVLLLFRSLFLSLLWDILQIYPSSVVSSAFFSPLFNSLATRARLYNRHRLSAHSLLTGGFWVTLLRPSLSADCAMPCSRPRPISVVYPVEIKQFMRKITFFISGLHTFLYGNSLRTFLLKYRARKTNWYWSDRS